MHNKLSIILLNYLLTHQSLLIIQIGVGAQQLSRSTEDFIPSVQHYDASQPSPPLVSVRVNVCICVCVHVRHVCMYSTCMCALKCVHIINNDKCIYMCVYVCVCMCVFVRMCMCTCMCMCMSLCLHLSGVCT